MKKSIELLMPYFKKDLASLISIKSYYQEKGPYPFGSGVQAALEEIVRIAKRLGFKTYLDPEGYYAYAEVGSGHKLFGVLGHVDVVFAEEEQWDSDPFELEERDGRFFGRGVLDDKGPILASMYALYALLDKGYELDQRIRFIFGADEESLWRCMQAYNKKEERPDWGFTPDASFPLIFAEKHLLQYRLVSHEISPLVMEADQAFNAVPDRVVLAYDAEVEVALIEKGIAYRREGDQLYVFGKSAHAMNPWEGDNAIIKAAKVLKEQGQENRLLNFMLDHLKDPYGLDLFGPISDEVSGPLSLNVANISCRENIQVLGIDLRIPVTADVERLKQELKRKAHQHQLVLEKHDELPSVYLEKESGFLKSLMESYQKITQDFETKALSSGGATYARAMENIVAFGPLFPGEKGSEHQANESIAIKSLIQAMEIYADLYQKLLFKEYDK